MATATQALKTALVSLYLQGDMAVSQYLIPASGCPASTCPLPTIDP